VVDLTLTLPDQILVGSAQDLETLDQLGVGRHGAMQMAVGAHQIGQHFRVRRVRLAARHPMAVAVTVDRLGVDGEHLIARGHQRPHEQPAIGLSAHHHLGGIIDELNDQRVEPGDTLHPLLQPRRRQPLAVSIEHHNVVVILRPVMPNEDQRHLLLGSDR
jgi:hypothetical protein